MLQTKDITITSLETITAFDVITGNYKFTLDELQNASIAQSQESTEITGKAGRKLATLKRNKSVTISGTNGLVSGGLIEMQTGSAFQNKATEVLWVDYLTVSNETKDGSTTSTAKTSYKATGTTGNEIENLYIRNDDGTLGTRYTQNSTAGEKTFTYTPGTNTISFYVKDNSGTKTPELADGTQIVVYYKRKIQADVLENKSDKFSDKCTLFIDALAEDKCSNVYRVQFYIPKADFSGEFSLEMGDNQTVHAFEAEALSGACGANGSLWTYTIFGSDAADAE